LPPAILATEETVLKEEEGRRRKGKVELLQGDLLAPQRAAVAAR
jgi:hypothetical protein